jgi:hypothetical protein
VLHVDDGRPKVHPVRLRLEHRAVAAEHRASDAIAARRPIRVQEHHPAGSALDREHTISDVRDLHLCDQSGEPRDRPGREQVDEAVAADDWRFVASRLGVGHEHHEDIV